MGSSLVGPWRVIFASARSVSSSHRAWIIPDARTGQYNMVRYSQTRVRGTSFSYSCLVSRTHSSRDIVWDESALILTATQYEELPDAPTVPDTKGILLYVDGFWALTTLWQYSIHMTGTSDSVDCLLRHGFSRADWYLAPVLTSRRSQSGQHSR